jgi:hypothetical protein
MKAWDRNPLWRFLQYAGASPHILGESSNLVNRLSRQFRAGRGQPSNSEHLLSAASLLLVVTDSITGLAASHFLHFTIEWKCQQLADPKPSDHEDSDSGYPQAVSGFYRIFTVNVSDALQRRLGGQPISSLLLAADRVLRVPSGVTVTLTGSGADPASHRAD